MLAFPLFLLLPALLAQVPGSYISTSGDISLSYAIGASAPEATLKITNVGPQAALFSTTDDQPWLSVFFDEPTVADVLVRNGLEAHFTVKADPTGLAPGTHRGIITIDARDIATGAEYDTKQLNVVLAVEGRDSGAPPSGSSPVPSPLSSPEPDVTPTPKPSEPATVEIPGVTKTVEGLPIETLISAWSDTGKSSSTRSGRDGAFSIIKLPTPDRWHIGASAELGGVPYRSSEVVVDTSRPIVPLELVLLALRSEPLPEPVEAIRAATERITLEVSDGAEVSIPPGAAGLEGSVSVEIKPLAEAETQKGTRIISTVYDISLKDERGRGITTLQKDIEITLPYRDEDLRAQGTREDRIGPAYFEALKKIWIRIGTFRIDKEKNLVFFSVRHLTRFALVAPADVQPPDPPSGVEARESLAGFVLRWQNPSYDFHHAKIYRSLVPNKIGTLAANYISGTTKEDTFNKGVGKVYYYVVRAIDLAGNESLNTKQISVRAESAVVVTPSPQPISSPAESPSVAPMPTQESPSLAPSVLPVPTEKPKGFFSRAWQAVRSFFQRVL